MRCSPFTCEWFTDFLFIHRCFFLQQEGSFRPFTHSLGNHWRMLHSFTPFLGTPRPGTECSRALRGPNPKRVRKEFERVSQGGAPESQRVRPGVRKESKNALFRLFSDPRVHSLGTLWLLGATGPGTPLWTLFGLLWGSWPKGPGSPLCYCIWAKWGRFVIFPVLCLLAYGETALKS